MSKRRGRECSSGVARPSPWVVGWVLITFLLQAACATGVPRAGVLTGSGSRPPAPRFFKAAGTSGSGGSVGVPSVSADTPVEAWGDGLEGLANPEEVRERVRRVEEARAEALVLAAQREGREPEEAREAEADRALARVVGLCSGVEEVGAVLAFTFWVEGGALTLVGYQEERGGGRVGRPVDAEGLARVLRLVLTEYAGRHTGEVVVRLRREEARWAVDYDASRPSARPPEARRLPVRTPGTPAGAVLTLQEAARRLSRAVQVPAGGAARVELEVRLEDGRLAGGELREVRRTREGPGGSPLALSPEVAGHLVQVLLPFTEGLGPRTVLVVLRAEHLLGEARARGWVESARVERPPVQPGQSWYLSMHEATLLRWREGVVEGSAWLAQRGVEEMALWFALGIIARSLGFFATEGLEWVTRALGREPEVVAGWLRTSLKRLTKEERTTFTQLWQKVALEGEQALSRSERKTLRGLFVRLEQAIQEPLNIDLKNTLREEARVYYAELYPQFARALKDLGSKFPVHHRRPLQYAHLFPDENINAAENLTMLQEYVHKEINFLWARFRKARPTPTADEVRRAAEIIDRQFEPWYHRIDDPSGVLKTAEQAKDAALRELQSRFPGLA
ncbi:hypothetical protein [Archangium lansingense]|uniref:Lipoprotein n=1 Tax=Archangium lansingense TaxID=2995310 RepID=A0ABT4A0J4_9BACT|nr:hypothetical protein [Archangium lansinium]MCY1075162.1 hypothetical protein [Archangium lansinium]